MIVRFALGTLVLSVELRGLTNLEKLASVAVNNRNTFPQLRGRFLFFVILAASAAPFW
jgi:hypothetical protein